MEDNAAASAPAAGGLALSLSTECGTARTLRKQPHVHLVGLKQPIETAGLPFDKLGCRGWPYTVDWARDEDTLPMRTSLGLRAFRTDLECVYERKTARADT
jgi:hypothetical protein